MDGEKEKAERNEMTAFWEKMETMGPGEVLADAEAFSKDRERLERLLEIGVEWLRDAVIYRITEDESLLVHGYSRDTLRKRAGRRSLQGMLADMERMNMSRHLLGRRVNAQLVAENLFLDLGKAHGAEGRGM
jgi:hypothetical protein